MYEELARRLAAAYHSYRLGIGMDYTMKAYIPDGPPGEFWLHAAKVLDDAVLQSHEEMLQESRAAKDSTPKGDLE